jgi:hypothetical protein
VIDPYNDGPLGDAKEHRNDTAPEEPFRSMHTQHTHSPSERRLTVNGPPFERGSRSGTERGPGENRANFILGIYPPIVESAGKFIAAARICLDQWRWKRPGGAAAAISLMMEFPIFVV